MHTRRRSSDGVDSFRRQMGALSKEARRPVVDQVQSTTPDDRDDEQRDEQGDERDDEHGT